MKWRRTSKWPPTNCATSSPFYAEPVARLILRDDERPVIRVTPLVGGVVRPVLLTLLGAVAVWLATHHIAALSRHSTVLWLLLVGPPALVSATRIARWRRHAIVVTSQRVVTMAGVLGRQVSSAELGDITVIHVDQRLHERVRRRGAVLVDVMDGSWNLGVVRHPGALARVIERQRALLTQNAEEYDPLVEPEDLGFELPSRVTILDEYRRRRGRA